MKKVQLTVNIENAAFEDQPEHELVRILRKLADTLESRGLDDDISIKDINGNTVGKFWVL